MILTRIFEGEKLIISIKEIERTIRDRKLRDAICFSVYPGDSRVTQEKLAPVPNFLPDTQSEGVWIQNLSTFCQVRTINVSLLMKIYNGGIIPACDNDFSYLNRVIFFNALGEKMQRRILKSESPIIERSYQRKQMTKRSHAAFTWVFVNVILAAIFFTEL